MKLISMLLIVSFLWSSNTFGSQSASASGISQAQETVQAAKFRQDVLKRGVGEKSRVKTKLSSGPEVKGYISKIDKSSFEVTDRKTGQTTTISYADVQQIQGPGLSKGEKIGIGVGVAAATVAIIVLIAWEQFKHSKGSI